MPKPALQIVPHPAARAARELFERAEEFVKLGQTDKAIAICDDIVDQFSTAKALEQRKAAAAALSLKNEALSWPPHKYPEERIKICDSIIQNYGHEIEFSDFVINALVEKSFECSWTKRHEEALACYNEIISRCESRYDISSNAKQRRLLAFALASKVDELTDDKERIAIIDELIKMFGDDSDDEISYYVHTAIQNRSTYTESINEPIHNATSAYARPTVRAKLKELKDEVDVHHHTLYYKFDSILEREGISKELRTQIVANLLRDIANAKVEATKPKLSDAELAEFREHAEKHPWKGDRKTSPSAFLKANFGKWLGRGLARKHLDEVPELKGLARAYSSEVRPSRHPERRLEGLIVEPHKLPADAPPRLRKERRVTELSEEQLKNTRAKGAARQARFQAKRLVT